MKRDLPILSRPLRKSNEQSLSVCTTERREIPQYYFQSARLAKEMYRHELYAQTHVQKYP